MNFLNFTADIINDCKGGYIMFRQSFNHGWTFWRQNSSKRYDITLPHDAMIAGNRRADSPAGSAGAFFSGDVYIYQKEFDVPGDWQQMHILFQFEGVYKNAKVYINDREAGGVAYGYIPFFVCADGLLKYGEKNVLCVVADVHLLPDSRWYTGGGIYRPVWLWTGKKTYIEPEGVRISTLSYAPARICIETAHQGGEITAEIWDAKGRPVAFGEGNRIELTIPEAHLWSDECPYLYTCHVRLRLLQQHTDSSVPETAVMDEATESFGIRKVEWSPLGLKVNGKETLLRGGCIHHDNGILGAAAYEESETRKVRILKEAGFNAIRSSHNPSSEAMLRACDRYGVYMIDETWDMWFHHKSRYDYASLWRANHMVDLETMIRRDFNHPSVIMYSIGNEVSEPAKDEGLNVLREMVDYIHECDPDRAVTGGFNLMIIASAKKGNGIYSEGGGIKSNKDKSMSGMNSTMFNMVTNMVGTGMNKSANSKKADLATAPSLGLLDISGYNYGSGRYPMEGKKHPGRVIMGSETFPQDIAKNWAMVKRYPYLIGDFMWTAWDYLGEAGLGAWAYTPDGKGFNKPYPWLLADCGVFDILGNPNAELYLAQAAWGRLLQAPAIAVQPVNHGNAKPAKMVWRGSNGLPGWSFQGCDGNKAVIEVYSSQPVVELFLNGKSLGKKKIKGCKAVYKTKYVPGELKAAAFDSKGRNMGESRLLSAQSPIAIQVLPEKATPGPGEVFYMDICLADKAGVVELNADTQLSITVSGGELLGFGSANPRTDECFHTGKYATYYGRCQAVLRAIKTGEIKVCIRGEGLEEKTVKILCEKG